MTRMKLRFYSSLDKKEVSRLNGKRNLLIMMRRCIASVMPKSPASKSESSMDPPREIFNFCQLPRELRDWIYDSVDSDPIRVAQKYLTHGGEEPDVVSNLQNDQMPYFFVLRPRRDNLLAMNRQFGAEYFERARRTTEILIVDHGDFQFATYDPKGTEFFEYSQGVTKLLLHMVIACSGICADRHSRCDVLRLGSFLVHTPPKYAGVREVELRLGIWGDWRAQWPAYPHGDDIVKALATAKITGAAMLKKLEIYQIPLGFEGFQDAFVPKNLFATWTPGNEWEPTPLAFPTKKKEKKKKAEAADSDSEGANDQQQTSTTSLSSGGAGGMTPQAFFNALLASHSGGGQALATALHTSPNTAQG